MFALALVVGSMTAFAETPTVVLPADSEDQFASLYLPTYGIVPADAIVSGAMRGDVEVDGSYVLYEPDPLSFRETMFDLFRVEGSGTVLNVAVLRSRRENWLGTQAGATATPDPGWEILGDVVWDETSGAYVVTESGELAFDFERDGVPDDRHRDGGQAGSGTLLETNLPPPPPPPLGGGPSGEPPILLYQGSGPGGEVWSLWLEPKPGRYDVELVLADAAGEEVHESVQGPPGRGLSIRLDGSAVGGPPVAELYVTSPDAPDASVPLPPDFSADRTRHRFGYLDSGSEEPAQLDNLAVSRWTTVLERQLVAFDDFEGGSWSGLWSSPEAGALKVQPDRTVVEGGPAADHVLAVSVPVAQMVGPDYLVRALEVPRAVVACRFDLDASSLTSPEPHGIAVFAMLDESQSPPGSQAYARLMVRHHQSLPEIRLLTGARSASATPWIPLESDGVTIEVQWRKTQAGGARLDLWVDGCGPDRQVCANGWELQDLAQPGLVTAVKLGAVGGLPGDGGVLRFDDVACVGDSWIDEVP